MLPQDAALDSAHWMVELLDVPFEEDHDDDEGEDALHDGEERAIWRRDSVLSWVAGAMFAGDNSHGAS